jgi:DNA ligase D-like protein (predicted polymerase)
VSDDAEILSIDGREVRVTHPSKLYFSKQVQVTKLHLVRYYLSVAQGALQGIRDRPIVLKRFVNGAEAEPFYQKRAPSDRPQWMRTVTLSFPSGRTAEEIVVDDAAGLAWIVNLGCLELHPHPVRTADLDHPDELRVDLDPIPGVGWDDVRRVAMEVKALLEEVGLRGWPKTSGSRGMHVNVRIEPRWTFTEVRRAALALSRAVERRVPQLASSKWWKEERHGVFLDYNQNAKDRTTCSAYSVRPLPDARVSTPLEWDEVMECDPAAFTLFTVPERLAKRGDPQAAMDAAAGSLEVLLEMAARDEAEGLGDAPWPPHFRKMEGEAPRVAPSRAKKEKSFGQQMGEGFGAHRFRKRSNAITDAEKESASNGEEKPAAKVPRTRISKQPLIIVAQSEDKEAAEAGLERWKQAHPEAAQHLAIDDVLVDRMRGASYVWYRIRVNLRHVPEEMRPAQGTPDPDDDPTRAWREAREAGTDFVKSSRARRKKEES